jgi:two-component system nitrate/nitrite response regulator NarL
MRSVVADDHPLYREALRLRLERIWPDGEVTEAGELSELLGLRDRLAAGVDLILLDLRMPGLADAGAVRRVIEAFPGAAVVLMSGSASAEDVKKAVQAGARGYLPKTLRPEFFASALAMIIGGGTYLPAEVLHATPVIGEPAPPAGADLVERLTPRERQVLVQLATGAPNKEIGRALGLAEVTVKLHVRQILKKIGARNRSEAAVIATKSGLI